MKPIKTVGVIGLGALGTLYAHLFTEALGRENVYVLADSARVERYGREGVWFNGERCDFNYQTPANLAAPVDLLLFAVKFGGLEDAIALCRPLVGPDTVILSVLNGIASEPMLGTAYGAEKVVWCVAQKMTAIKEGSRVEVSPMGELALGVPAGMDDAPLRRLTAFFDDIAFSYSLPADIRHHMWSKLLCNTGCNQATMVYQCNYGQLRSGEGWQAMISAMREVLAVANAEGVDLTEADLQSWLDVLNALPDHGEPSMRQDGKAHRKSEVELFSGTIRRLAAKHNIPTPVNDWFYKRIKEMEAAY